tara:strand:- start:600 stop:848 length:249 start_codon:yes stop_codon:yes gene_type:complete
MKVGDLVQRGSRVIEMRKGGKKQNPPKRVGVVIEIHEIPPEMLNGRTDWAKILGRTIHVLWDNGMISKNFSENLLEVISEGR